MSAMTLLIFDLECGDSVEIYDGVAHQSMLCGRSTLRILATGLTVLIKFVINDITEGTGFHLRYELRGRYLHIVKCIVLDLDYRCKHKLIF